MKVLAALLGLVLLAGCLDVYVQTRATRIVGVEKAGLEKRELGATRFVFDDLGGLNTNTLNTNAFPWKVVVTAMAMEYASQQSTAPSAAMIPAMFRRYGWIMPQGIDNWPGAAAPAFDRPVGIVSGELRRSLPRIRLEVANMGCAACHAGMSYDASGEPTGRVWLGSPNTSRYFDGYTQAILSALRSTRDRHDALMATIPQLFPDVSKAELQTIRKYVLPQITKRLADADANREILVLFDHGGAGLTNGIAALKLRLDAKPSLVAEQREHGYASIPDLYGRRLRSSVLYDGLYSLRADRRFVERREGDFSGDDLKRLSSIVAFFVVPSMGIRPDESERQARRIADILDFVLDYQPQPYPGTIDQAKAAAGGRLYASGCASCHGVYEGSDRPRLVSYPNRLVPQSEIGSDPERWRAITDRMVKVIGETPVAKRVNAANAQGYVPPILNGLWASAPYLHNGSVPTLWHLMRPGTRPAKFMVGGHKLDLQRMGIAGETGADGVYRYPQGYQPWSTPVLIDTAAPGRGNRGHEKEFAGLSEAEKDALAEFLKQL